MRMPDPMRQVLFKNRIAKGVKQIAGGGDAEEAVARLRHDLKKLGPPPNGIKNELAELERIEPH
jgi:hypothetical protein